MQEIIKNCPSCGAKIQIVPGIITYVCPYCNTILTFQQEELATTGGKSQIIPFPTTFKVNEIFYAIKDSSSNDEIAWIKVKWLSEKEYTQLKPKSYIGKFQVIWQIRYNTENALYDKFFLRILDDKTWLDKNKILLAEEDEWQILLYYVENVEDKWTFDKFYNLKNPVINWFFIQEVWVQQVEGFNWAIPLTNILWVKASKYVNMISPGIKKIVMEKYDNGAFLYAEQV